MGELESLPTGHGQGDFVIPGGRTGTTPGTGPVYEQLWSVPVEVVFSATPEEAEARVREITASILAIEAVWEVEADFDPEQKTETVDV